MASTYVNDLRLNEMATGDGSGTWGTTTNTNLELIAEAFSYGTEVITTNADTHTTTIADGATDPGRSLYLKYTGTLDSACTITIGPNTVSKVWIIENGTSGSQNIIISQGSGATITIPAGDTKVVYSDGAGAGAAFVDAFASLSVVDLKVQDDLTVTGDITGTLATAAQPNITSVGTLTGFTSTGIDDNADATAITIDSSERVVVGNTSPFTADSVTIDQGGFLAIRNTSASGMEVRRDGTDGNLIDFQKAGTAVGSIGTANADSITIGNSTGNLILYAGTVAPSSNSSGGASDGVVDLGTSARRFKELYLSGGVYLGGTGAANLLDDYEEGTWTPSTPVGLTSTYARYTKVGNRVFFDLEVTITTNSNAGQMQILSLPFAVSGEGSATLGYTTATVSNPVLMVQGTGVYFYSGGSVPVAYSDYSNKVIRLTGTYMTTV
jgi:hypothetical protein